MTLIVGTQHWDGICITADTRATYQTVTGDHTYRDDTLKVDLITGGLGMAAAGNTSGNIIFKSLLKKLFEECVKNPTTETREKLSSDPVGIAEELVNKALTAILKHPDTKRIKDLERGITIKGILGGYLEGIPLVLNKYEAINLMEILINSPSLNKIYSNSINRLSDCLNGSLPVVIFPEFNQTYLITYSQSFNDKEIINKQVTRVPFGKIVAFGSGSEFAFETFSPRVLGWVLFAEGSEDISNAVIQLTQIHGYADKEVPDDPLFDFKTFGGGIVPVAIARKDDKSADAKVILYDLHSKPERNFICEVFEKNGKLWVKTQKKEDYELIPFPNISVPDGVLNL